MTTQLPPPLAAAAKSSGLATASLVLGILGLTCLLPVLGSVLAVVLGGVALGQIKASPGALTGRGKALAGLIMGSVGVLLIPLLGILAAILLPALNQAREAARQANCKANLRQIGIACAMYADRHDGVLPHRLADLTDYLGSSRVLICPSAVDQTVPSYAFTGATNAWGVAREVVIVRETQPHHRRVEMVLYDDGRVLAIPVWAGDNGGWPAPQTNP